MNSTLEKEMMVAPTRHFLPSDFKISSWEDLKPYFDSLLNRDINTPLDMEAWLKEGSELGSVIEEQFAWKYIDMTCDTADQEKADLYKYFVTEIQPQMSPVGNQLDKKTLALPFLDEYRSKTGYDIMIKMLEKDVALFREENVPIQAEIQADQQKYSAIMGALTVEIDGEELTVQQASAKLQDLDRTYREKVWRAIQEKRAQDEETLDQLFNDLVQKRDAIAKNAGFDNYRDYSFKSRGRFDYDAKDCEVFHDAIAQEVVPVTNLLVEQRKKMLGVDALKPWDKAVDKLGKPALIAFKDEEDLIDKSIRVFEQLDPYFGDSLRMMKKMGRLDLASRKGKAPGGYNYPLHESNVPFIFMNATSTVRDVVTLMHEGGHAVHSISKRDLTLEAFKNITPEIAELASMAMELMSLDHWDVFFPEKKDLRRAKLDHLEDVISTLPWVAIVDKFQHWIYTHPNHTITERQKAWESIFTAFSDNITDWTGLEKFRKALWHKQLHIFEIPFYYIEYAIAQLGAIAMWKQFRENKAEAIENYKNALKLGYTKSIPEMYATAGIKFDFSQGYIKELMDFVQAEIKTLAD